MWVQLTIYLHSTKSSLPSLYPLHHPCNKVFQALSVLQSNQTWEEPGNDASKMLCPPTSLLPSDVNPYFTATPTCTALITMCKLLPNYDTPLNSEHNEGEEEGNTMCDNPGRNQVSFHCVFRPHYCFQSVVPLNFP